jgi:ribonuclease E
MLPQSSKTQADPPPSSIASISFYSFLLSSYARPFSEERREGEKGKKEQEKRGSEKGEKGRRGRRGEGRGRRNREKEEKEKERREEVRGEGGEGERTDGREEGTESPRKERGGSRSGSRIYNLYLLFNQSIEIKGIVLPDVTP